MDEKRVNISHVVGTASAFIGFVLLVIGLATPAWTSEGGLPRTGGPVPIQTARGFIFIGLLNQVFGIVFAVAFQCNKAFKNSVPSAALMIAGGILGAIAAAIFTGYQLTTLPGIPFGYSFYVTWVQTLFSVGGGVIILYEGRKITEEQLATFIELNKAN